MYGNGHKNILIMFTKLFHFLLCVSLFYISWILFRYGEFSLKGVGYRYNYYVTVGYAIILFFFNRIYNSYLLGYSKRASLIFSHFLAQFFTVGIVWAGVTVAWRNIYNPVVFATLLAAQLIVNIAWSCLGTNLYFKFNKSKKTIFIYRNSVDKYRFGITKGKQFDKLYNVEKEIQFDGTFSELLPLIKEYEAIFVAGLNSRCRNGVVKYCKEKNIPGYFLPHVGDVIMQEAEHIQTFDSPVLYINRKVLKPEYLIIKRIFDIVFSGVGIIILSPIFLIVALLIKLSDHGPAFYKQIRLTKDGKKFKILKFRSMRVDAEKDGVARLSLGENDNRITPIGKFVRKCRLDELPQLFNVLMGDMSLVGPRPERPEIAEQYYKTMPDFKMRLQVKAGLTGYAQVYGKYNTDPYNKLELDLIYIKNMSLLTDLRLLFATVEILFSSESTEGVSEGQTTAIKIDGESDEKTDS